LPPQKSGISDYSFDLLQELARQVELVAVVRDDVVGLVRAPSGVLVAGASAYVAGRVGLRDLDIYQMGNHPWFHGYMHARAMHTPGLLVLHDVALLDFYAGACGSMDSPVLMEEARLEDPEISDHLPTVVVDGRKEPDRLRVPLARRLIEASLLTIVHSASLRDQLAQRYPGAAIRHVNQPVRNLESPARAGSRPAGQIVFGIFGSLERHKRVRVALKAFARVHESFPGRARLVIAGRPDNPGVERDVQAIIRSSKIGDAVRVLTDLPLRALEAEIANCDVAICLRWPTAGEVSAVLMRALGAGKPVIVSDVPQYRDLDPAFCWRVSTEPSEEPLQLEALMRRIMEDPQLVRSGGAAARAFAKAEATISAAAVRYLEAIEESQAIRAAAASRRGSHRPTRTDVPGVNVIADWEATTGLAEAARRSAGALIEAGIAVSANGVDDYFVPRDPRRAPDWLRDLPSGRQHDIDICYLNVNELHVMSENELRPRGNKNYVIGYWFWELPSIATAFVDQIARVDEIWVGSNFTKEAFLGHTDKPVKVMPCVVSAPPSAPAARAQLELPDESCLFFFHFDAFSTLARKNPWAVIRAFHRAFTPEERSGPVRLVMKTINLSRCPPAAGERLRQEMHEVDGILLDMELSRLEMASLIASSDVYVSLHRSEGFGLGIAEAMLAGLPAIATAYSGNMDFMTHQNSCLVGYGLTPVSDSEFGFNPGMEFVYEPDQLWAEPNVVHAARWMRLLYESQDLRERIGAAGAETVRTRYSSTAAGAAGAARLAEIASSRRRARKPARGRNR
jgi:glycosyltransferase involved in cell wall biosynthesis